MTWGGRARLGFWLLVTVVSVLVRRALHGPRRPGWGLKSEIAVAFTLRLQRRYPNFDLELARHLVGDIPPRPETLRGVRVEEIDLAGLHAFRITPDNAVAGRTFLHFHGGGYIMGTASGCRSFVAQLARGLRATVVTVDYRMAPEDPFPAALDDAFVAYRALLDDGQDPRRLLVGGDSAGGGMTFALALRLRDEELPLPAMLFGFSPWIQLTCGGPSSVANLDTDVLDLQQTFRARDLYCAGHDPKDPLCSPTYGDLRGLPPTFLLAGGAEIFESDIRTFAEKLRAAGVQVELEVALHQVHTWLYLADLLPDCGPGTVELGRRLAERLERGLQRASA